MPQNLLDWLVARFPTAKRQTLKRMVQARRVSINGRPALTLKDPLNDTDKISVDERPTEQSTSLPDGLQIIFEDTDILVVNKPAGLLTSTVPREPRPTLWAIARDYVQANEPRARVGLIHRLDRDASGLLVFSKNDLAYQSLKMQFFKHTVHREYTAVVHGIPVPPQGQIQTHLAERADGTVYSTQHIEKGQIGTTKYELVKPIGEKSLLRVVLETGRKHQIRVHLSEGGWPIVGDKVYGKETDTCRLMLAATKLTLQHPREQKEMTFTIPAPVGFPSP
jgi:23S rRNA pseudouridine1911/1915/1917 synthase